jgi:hypothetical protein
MTTRYATEKRKLPPHGKTVAARLIDRTTWPRRCRHLIEDAGMGTLTVFPNLSGSHCTEVTAPIADWLEQLPEYPSKAAAMLELCGIDREAKRQAGGR